MPKRSPHIEIVLATASFAIIAVIIYLSIILPSSYQARNWNIAWIGFDSAILASILLTLWSIWKQRQMAIISSAMAGTLLIIDSWFDVATSRAGHDFYVALATALFLQLPFSAVLFRFSRKFLHHLVESSYIRAGLDVPKTSFFRSPLVLFLDEE